MFFNKYQKEYDELFEFITKSQYDSDFGIKKEYAKEFLTFYQKPIGKKLVQATITFSSPTDLFLGKHFEEALLLQAYDVFLYKIYNNNNPPTDKISLTAVALLDRLMAELPVKEMELVSKYCRNYYFGTNAYNDVRK
jgi:hypothetical protein